MRILLALDGSEHALVAVRHVLQLWQEGLPMDVLLANVQEPPHLYELVMAPDAEVIDAAAQAAGEHALAAAYAALRDGGVPAEALGQAVGHGEPVPTLIELAELNGCDVICLATHGSGWLASTRLGRVATGVAQQASCAVWIVREPEPTDDEATAP